MINLKELEKNCISTPILASGPNYRKLIVLTAIVKEIGKQLSITINDENDRVYTVEEIIDMFSE